MKMPEEVAKFFKDQGKRGGKARAKNLTSAERKAIAKKAAQARWAKKET